MIKKVIMIIITIIRKDNSSKIVPQAQSLISKLITKQMDPSKGAKKSCNVVICPERWYKWWQPETEDESLLLCTSADRCRQHSPPLSFFSCLVTQHTLLFGVTMNHGN